MNPTHEEATFSCRPNLPVMDVGASLEFYRATLGFRVGWDGNLLRSAPLPPPRLGDSSPVITRTS